MATRAMFRAGSRMSFHEVKMESINECQWPSEAWWDALHDQSTPATIGAAMRVAAHEVARLATLGIVAPWDDEDIVQRILVATCDGERRWDPNACSLRAYLCNKVRDAARGLRDPRRAVRETVALDDLDDDDPTWADAAMVTDGARVAAMRDVARRVEGSLWQRAASDPIALRVLGAMSAGATSEVDLADETGLPLDVVRTAVRRIRRMALALPDQLVRDVRAVLNAEASTDG